MDAIETLRQDVQAGRVSADRLVDLIASLQRQLQTALKRIEELEKKVGGPSSAKLAEPFSMRAEEQRQEKRGKKSKPRRQGRRGRVTTKDKIAQAERTDVVFPTGVARAQCYLSHVRPVWRLENGRAVLIAYEIYRGPSGEYGQIPGVLGRSEFGLEIVTEIAYLVYIVGLSFDKVCLLLHFFQNLELKKAQANVLLYRLARHWEREFEVLCTLLANSLVVHADETSWSLHSVWALLSEKARVLLFGVHKDAETLRKILDPATFGGLVISDDAAVYENFSQSQKCWAHLLRKAIQLTLQEPNCEEYRTITDQLLAIYREACRVQRDRRLSDAGRAQKVTALDDKVAVLCLPVLYAESPLEGHVNDYRLLLREIFRLMIHQELFQFVTAPPVKQPNSTTKPVSGTNNEAERTLRGPAQARGTGRTNKTSNGTRRQTVLTSVLESLRLYLPIFTLESVLEELKRWCSEGQSCFAKLLHKLHLTLLSADGKPIIDQLFPSPVPTG